MLYIRMMSVEVECIGAIQVTTRKPRLLHSFVQVPLLQFVFTEGFISLCADNLNVGIQERCARTRLRGYSSLCFAQQG